MAEQINILTPLGGINEVAARALRAYGFEAWRRYDYGVVYEILKPLALAGDREALFALVDASILEYPDGYVQAELDLLKRAADTGDMRASALYAWMFLTRGFSETNKPSKNPALVMPLIERLRNAAATGDPHAKAYWGAFQFEEPPLTERSGKLGKKLLEEAAQEGVAFAHFFLGDLYGRGELGFFNQADKAIFHLRAAHHLKEQYRALKRLIWELYEKSDTDADDPDYQESLRLSYLYYKKTDRVGPLGSSYRYTKSDQRKILSFLMKQAVFDGNISARKFFGKFYWTHIILNDDRVVKPAKVDFARHVAWYLLAADPVARRKAAELDWRKRRITESWGDAVARVNVWLLEQITISGGPEKAEQALREGRALADAFREAVSAQPCCVQKPLILPIS